MESHRLCPHFGACGGCAHQDRTSADYLALKRSLVSDALARHGFGGVEILPLVSVPARSRRRASLQAVSQDGGIRIGFSARASHDIVDMQTCLVLRPKLVAAIAALRPVLSALLKDGEGAGVHLTETASGLDLALELKRALKPPQIAMLARWAEEAGIARITAGGQIAALLAPPAVRLADVDVLLPPKTFLQPTREGEAVLQRLVREGAGKAKRVADLFSGCGTFALALAPAAQVHCVESDAAALAALAEGVRHAQGLKPVATERRDLVKLPLTPPELKPYDAVVLDPPRAGALEQVRMLAASAVKRVVYVSCNPQTFARDARVLGDAGFAMGAVTPVDQFLWSDHVELAATFTRR